MTAFTCRAGCKERDASKNRNAGPVKCNALLSRGPAKFVQPCRFTMKSIQIGAKGDVRVGLAIATRLGELWATDSRHFRFL